MADRESQIVIANQLEKMEKLLSEIYKIFSVKFPDQSSFWNDLSVEENTHALMMATLKTMIHDGSQYFDNRDFKLPDILKLNDKLKNFSSEIEQKDVSAESAVKFAVFAEGHSLDRDIFKTSENDSAETKRVFAVLKGDTQRHYDTVRKLLEKVVKP